MMVRFVEFLQFLFMNISNIRELYNISLVSPGYTAILYSSDSAMSALGQESKNGLNIGFVSHDNLCPTLDLGRAGALEAESFHSVYQIV
jgi:hypothetical protein